jgi:hypothetical protein
VLNDDLTVCADRHRKAGYPTVAVEVAVTKLAVPSALPGASPASPAALDFPLRTRIDRVAGTDAARVERDPLTLRSTLDVPLTFSATPGPPLRSGSTLCATPPPMSVL